MSPRFPWSLRAACAVAPLVVAACGGRIAPDDTTGQAGLVNAGVGVSPGAGGQPAGTAGLPSLGSFLASVDGGLPVDGGPLVACGACAAQSCGAQTLTCVSSAPCLQALQCDLQKCMSGGFPDVQCLATCSSAAPGAAAQVDALLLCIAGSCSGSCMSLAGSGGLGGAAN